MKPGWVVLFGGLGLLALTRRFGVATRNTVPVVPADWLGWVWPVPIDEMGRVPRITDGFSWAKTSEHRKHLGVDIMYAKLPDDPVGNVKHDASKLSIAPRGTYVIAPGPGRVWDAGEDSYGKWLLIDHGNLGGSTGGVTTRYAHLESFARPWKRGDFVAGTQPLGLMGYSPTNDSEQLRHLHFELRFPRVGVPQPHWVADPAPYMRHWRKVPLQENVS